MIKKCPFFILSLCIASFILQSCWKDDSLKDKGFDEFQVNISPTFGVPLANLTLTGGDIVKQLNMTDSSQSFFIEYDANGLCVIVYDKTNLEIKLPPVLPFDTMLAFPINYFSDLRIDGITVKQAAINMNIDNGYTKNIEFRINDLEYEDESGSKKPITHSSELNEPNRIEAAKADGQSTRTELFKKFLIVDNPSDIINHGIYLHFRFGLIYELLENNASIKLNPIIKIPAWFAMENFSLRDTIEANLENLGDIINNETISLNTATLYLTIKNGLPFEANLQVYFADNNYQLIDSLQKNEMQIQAGQANNPTSDSFEITMSRERFKKIEKSKYIIFKEGFRTRGGEDVKLYKSNTLGIILSAKANADINGSLSDIDF